MTLAILAGCAKGNQSPSAAGDDGERPLAHPPPATQSVQEKPFATRMQPTMVSEGSLPLVYLNPSGANYTFTDLTTHRELGSGFVPSGQIIRLDKRGVFAGERAIAPMSLDEAHRYGIVYQPDPTSVMRTATGQPTPASPPASPPAPPPTVSPQTVSPPTVSPPAPAPPATQQ